MHCDTALPATDLRWYGLIALGLLLLGCTTVQNAGTPGLPQKRGTASYYADKFVGRTTANGEIFYQERLTAAHRTLPFGTRVRATRLDASERPSVVVRINDRGPFKDNRIIDFTKNAAKRLGMIDDGLAEVELEVISYPAGTSPPVPDSSEGGATGADTPNVAW